MEKLFKSKIFYINAVLMILAVIELAVGIYGLNITHILFAQGVLTIVLRMLQGQEIKIGGKMIKL